jgi:hypothetical protein
MAVSDDTVSTLAGVSTVYVIDKNKARQQVVALGSHEGKLWEITDGLKGDEVLASSNLSQLATGTTVRIGSGSDEEGAMPAPEGSGRRGRGRGQGGAPKTGTESGEGGRR